MSDNANLQMLIENVDELYELAKLTECKIDVPVSELRKSFERGFERAAPKIGARISVLASKGKMEEVIITGGILCVAYVGATAVDFARNKAAQKKAREILLPVYREMAVKMQIILQEVCESRKRVNELLQEERLRNIDNQIKIEKLNKRIEKGEKILQRFMELQAKGNVANNLS